MPTAHAILSPSAAHRWMNCTRSARLEQDFPDTKSEAAAEGTLAHSLGELLIQQKLGWIAPGVIKAELDEIEKNSLYNHAMLEHCEAYAVFVLEKFAEAQTHTPDAAIFLEHHLNLTEYVTEGFGTGDAGIIADSVLDCIDLKYGKGVLVSAEHNEQMMLYALGWLRDFDFMYDIKTIRMTIFQPRIDNYSSWEISVEDLKQWAKNVLVPKAALAFEGKGDFVPGSHCQFCKVKATCKAFANYNLGLAKHDFRNPDLLDDDDIADILNKADVFENWLKAVQEYAFNEALSNGKKWPGWKLVEGRSNRQYSDSDAVERSLLKSGYDLSDISERKILGITAMEKLLGKQKFAALLNDLIIKPPGKPTLAPYTDKRTEYNSLEKAKQDFS